MSAMTAQAPTQSLRCRARYSEFDGLRIEIPGRPNPLTLTVSGILTAAGLLIILGWLARRGFVFLVTQDPTAFVIPTWLILLMVMTGYPLVVLLASLRVFLCREVVETDGQVLVLSSRGYLFAPHGPRIFGLSKVSNLRYSPMYGLSKTLVFDFDGLTISFGRGLSEREALRLIQTVKDHYRIPDREAEPLRVSDVANSRESISYQEPGSIRLAFDDIDGLRIAISGISTLGAVFALGFVAFLLVLAAVFYFTPPQGAKPEDGPGPRGVSFMILFMSAYLAAIVISAGWAGTGREIIRIDGSHLIISRVGGMRPRRSDRVSSLDGIRNLRFAPAPPECHWAESCRPAIAFDAGEATVRFGRGLSETNARRLIRTIKDRYKIPDDRNEALPVELL